MKHIRKINVYIWKIELYYHDIIKGFIHYYLRFMAAENGGKTVTAHVFP